MRIRKERFKSKKLGDFVAQLASERYSDKWILRELSENLIHHFGGAKALARYWHEQLQACPAGSRLGVQSGIAITRMLRMAEVPAPQRKRMNPEDMTTKEIEEEITTLVEEKAMELLAHMQAERRKK